MGNYKGKNVDEAIENGLSELNLKKSEVKINIIDHGNAGVFGFFEKEAEVEITPLSPMELKIKKLIIFKIKNLALAETPSTPKTPAWAKARGLQESCMTSDSIISLQPRSLMAISGMWPAT